MSRAWSTEGKIVLVTGGSSGIGLAVARLLAASGAHLWLLARREDRLNEALAEVEACSRTLDQRFGVIPADVSDEREVREAIARVNAEVGLPDLVINSAGITYPGYVQDLDISIFRSMMEVNYFGTVYVTKAVLPGMLLRGSGYIVNIASLAGLIGVFGYTAYGASKFAVRGFTDALRAEVKPYGIGVSIVYPPDTDTPQLAYENQFKPAETRALSSMNAVLPPETVAKAILDGVARRRYVILPGFESKLTYWLVSLSGTLAYPVVDWLIARARREMRVKEPA